MPKKDVAPEVPETVKVQYVGGHSEVRSSISGNWKKDEVKDLDPDVAAKLLATRQFKAPKGGN